MAEEKQGWGYQNREADYVPPGFDWSNEFEVHNILRNTGVAGLKGAVGFANSLAGIGAFVGDQLLSAQDESMKGTRFFRNRLSSFREKNVEPAQRELRNWYTPGVSHQSQSVDDAFDRGFFEGMRAAARNPAGALVNAGESLVGPVAVGKAGPVGAALLEGAMAFGESNNAREGVANAGASLIASGVTGGLGRKVLPSVKGVGRTALEEVVEVPIVPFGENYVVPYSFDFAGNMFSVQRAEANQLGRSVGTVSNAGGN